MNTPITLPEWAENQSSTQTPEGVELSAIFQALSLLGKMLTETIRSGGVDLIGAYGSENASGDSVQKLDVLANTMCKEFASTHGRFAAIASEEEEEIVYLEESITAPYLLAFDPLDGSKNIDFNGPIGTIFTIYKRSDTADQSTIMADFLSATTIAASGFVLYGPRTLFIFSIGDGVHTFQLDPETQEWILLQDTLSLPDPITTYAHNDSYVANWDSASQQYLTAMKERHPDTTARHIGALLADIYRILVQGGIFIRAFDNASKRSAKLRLVYELRAMAFIIEQAGGAATDGLNRILTIDATDIHHRHPLIAGNIAEVQEYERVFRAS